MARIVYGPLIQQATGTLGSLTFKRTNATNTVTVKPRPGIRQSEDQLTNRRDMATLRKAYQNLTTVERDGWRNLARQTVTTTPEGTIRPRTALGLFVEWNWLPLRIFGITVNEAAVAYVQSPLIDVQLISAPLFPLTVNGSDGPGGPFNFLKQIEGSYATNGPGRNWSNWKPVLNTFTLGDNIDISAEWDAAGLPRVDGMRARVRVRMQTPESFPSKPFIAETIVFNP